MNVPEEEFNSIERVFFQIEGAHWYYEDFCRKKWPTLPHFKNLRQFAERCMFVFGLVHSFQAHSR